MEGCTRLPPKGIPKTPEPQPISQPEQLQQPTSASQAGAKDDRKKDGTDEKDEVKEESRNQQQPQEGDHNNKTEEAADEGRDAEERNIAAARSTTAADDGEEGTTTSPSPETKTRLTNKGMDLLQEDRQEKDEQQEIEEEEEEPEPAKHDDYALLQEDEVKVELESPKKEVKIGMAPEVTGEDELPEERPEIFMPEIPSSPSSPATTRTPWQRREDKKKTQVRTQF